MDDQFSPASKDIKILSTKNRDVVKHNFYSFYRIKSFIDQLFGDESDGQLMFCAGDEHTIHLYDAELTIEFAGKASELSKTMDILFCPALLDYHSLNFDYDGEKDVTVVPGLWINIGILTPDAKTEQLPSLAEALEFLKSPDMKPNIIVNTGSELQAYWIFDQPFIIDSSDAYDEITKLSHDFQQRIIADGLQRGWIIEDTSNIDHYQRLPGTWNWKHYPPTPIMLLEPENDD